MPKTKGAKTTPKKSPKPAKKRLSKKITKTPIKSPLKSIIKDATQSVHSLAAKAEAPVGKEVQFVTTEVEMHLSDLELDFENDSDLDINDFELGEQPIEHEVEVEASEKDESDQMIIEEEFIIEESEVKSSQASDESDEKDKFVAADKIRFTKLPKTKDFFMILGTIPNINEMPLSPSDLIEPGTIHLLEPQATPSEEEEQTMVSDEISAEAVELSTEFSELDYEIYSSEEDLSVAERASIAKKEEAKNLFEMLVELQSVAVKEIDEDIFVEMARMNELKLLQEDTASFLEQLIECVVQAAEYVDVDEELRSKLDKVKLVRAISDIFDTHILERKAYNFLHRKCVDFYKRRRNFGPIMPDPEGYLETRMNHFHRALTELNGLLGKETAVEERTTTETQIAQDEVDEMENNLKAEIAELEKFIRSTFQKRRSTFRAIVDEEIERMALLRDEISETRVKCLLHQNKLNSIKAEINILEDLGDNLTMTGYQSLTNEFFVVKRKYEDRLAELLRVRDRFLNSTQILTHMRERRTMLCYTVSSQNEILQNMLERKQELSAFVHKMRINHIRLQKVIWNKSANSGLVDKPALCRDYDMTVEKIDEVKKKVNALKAKVANYEKRIRICEEKMKARERKIKN